MKTHIVICRTYNNLKKTVWLEDCADFWAAVEKARYIPQNKLPLAALPNIEGLPRYLIVPRMLDYTKDCRAIQEINYLRIAEILEIKKWAFNEND